METYEQPLGPPVNSKQKRRVKPAVIASAVVVAVIAVGGGVYASLTSKTPMETAYENCNGKQAFTRVFELEAEKKGLETDKTQTPEAEAPEAEEADADDGIAQYFEGVLALEDDGRTLVVDTLGQDKDPFGLGSFTAQCVYLDLETPTWVQESVATTRALDGRQSAEWPGYQAQWGYHPDSGLSMIITVVGK